MNQADPTISAAARAHLRKVGRSLPVLVRVGKAGVTPAVVRQVAAVLGDRELAKVRALDSAGIYRLALAEQLRSATGSALVGVVGRTMLLYRPNADLPAGSQIELP